VLFPTGIPTITPHEFFFSNIRVTCLIIIIVVVVVVGNKVGEIPQDELCGVTP
jgi:hypothetical protein